jgi:hypothetical protein
VTAEAMLELRLAHQTPPATPRPKISRPIAVRVRFF